MKEKEARVDYKKHQLVLYVEKKNGSYGPLKTGSYITKNYLDDYWLKRENLEKEYLGKVKNGEISPIAFYMILEELTPSELAARVKIPVRKVKKHLQPGHFGDMTVEELGRYSDVFNIPLVNLFYSIEAGRSDLKIKEEKTGNPLYGILRIEALKR
jgi:hypothetical protein